MVFTLSETYINPLGLVFALAMGFLLVVIPRRYAVVPIVMLMCYMTMGTRVVVGGFTFTMLRVLLIFGWTRLIVRGEIGNLKLNRIDKVIIAFVVSSLVTYTLLWQSYDAFKNKLGLAYNVIGFFFLFRYLLRNLDDAIRLIRIMALLIVPLALLMLVEKTTGHNLFAPLGGVPAISAVREGAIRCQGAFAHPILAGSFGATLLPMFLVLWFQRDGSSRLRAALGVVSSVVIVVCAASSGPVLAALAGVGGLLMWTIRTKMRQIRWGIVLLIVVLQLFMKAPVWFLIGRIDIFAGNTGWHRAHLIDTTYRNLSDWWLVGTRSNDNWDEYDHNYDITNQYINYGVEGGLITMALFVLTIVRCFSGVGYVRRVFRSRSRADQLFVWAMGAALFAHTVNYFSVSYFDQNIISWFMLLAMISSVSDEALLLMRKEPRFVKAAKPALPVASYA